MTVCGCGSPVCRAFGANVLPPSLPADHEAHLAPCPRCGGRGDRPPPIRLSDQPLQRGDGSFICDFCRGSGHVGNAACWTGPHA